MTAFESDVVLALAAEFGMEVECRMAEETIASAHWNNIPCHLTVSAPQVQWVAGCRRWDVAIVGDELIVGGWQRFCLADPALISQVRDFLGVER